MHNSLPTPRRTPRAELFASLPAEWPQHPGPALSAVLGEARQKVVVLDDDPTGTQTVHGVPVLTAWTVEALQAELANDLPAFYLLTNSRSLPLEEARAMNAGIGKNLVEAAGQAGTTFVVVSRGDSTLRGHFPGEVEALIAGLGSEPDACLLIPFFEEGGRYTVHDVHYVADGDWLVPAAETPYAKDSAFGYHNSNLRRWVEEKSGGRVPFASVASVSLDDIRRGGPARVAAKLKSLSGGGNCVVNAVSRRDLEVFTQGLLDAEHSGKRFLYRTAASFVPVRAGLSPRPLLSRDELALPAPSGGLIVVGSHVPATSLQLERLRSQAEAASVEVSVAALLDDSRCGTETERVAKEASRHLQSGEDVIMFTSREVVSGGSAGSSLSIGQRISAALVATVRAITVRPRYLLAKGGITSSDIATRGLDVKRALVLGQILPGVPVWQLGIESRYPGLCYIVFPGNVGGPEALADIVRTLKGKRP